MALQRIRPQILTAAIALFGRSGYDQITTTDLAREASVLEASIHRYFRSKKRLYAVALHSVVDGSIRDLTQFALGRFQDDSVMKDGFEPFVVTAIRRWYLSFSKEGARLLKRAIMTDTSRKMLAYSPLEQITAILTGAMQDYRKTNAACDGKTLAATLISHLFQVKLREWASTSRELQETDRIVHEWIVKLPQRTGKTS